VTLIAVSYKSHLAVVLCFCVRLSRSNRNIMPCRRLDCKLWFAEALQAAKCVLVGYVTGCVCG